MATGRRASSTGRAASEALTLALALPLLAAVALQGRPQDATAAEILGGLLGAALTIGGGALLVARLTRHRPLVAGIDIITVSMTAAPPAVLALAVNPLVEPWDQYGIAAYFFILGVFFTVVFATGSAYGMGAGLAGYRRPAAAFRGAVFGSILGIAAAVLADGGIHHLLDRFGLDVVALRWAAAVGIVGVGAVLTCELAGGGPASAAG